MPCTNDRGNFDEESMSVEQGKCQYSMFFRRVGDSGRRGGRAANLPGNWLVADRGEERGPSQGVRGVRLAGCGVLIFSTGDEISAFTVSTGPAASSGDRGRGA